MLIISISISTLISILISISNTNTFFKSNININTNANTNPNANTIETRAERFNLTKEEKNQDRKRKLLEEIKEKDPALAEQMLARQKRFAKEA